MEERKAKVYCSERCHPCHALCEWLDYIGLPYEKITDRSKFPKGVFHIPTFEFEGEVISGYDRMAITQLLCSHNAFPEKR